jgi:ParB-like chromosome segregation protein Spo0J
MATIREQAVSRRDIMSFAVDMFQVDPGFNARLDYGDLDELAQRLAQGWDPSEHFTGYYKDGKIVLTDGHRRLRAIKEYLSKYTSETFKAIPCIIEEKGVNEEERVLRMLRKGTGKPLTLLEEAACIIRLQKFGLTVADIAKRIGRTPMKIHQLIDLNGASKALRDAIQSQVISATAALKVAKAPTAQQETLMARLNETLSTNGGSKKKKALKVKDVENATKGTAYNVSGRKIRDAATEVRALIKSGKNATQWTAVLYGLEIALGKKDLDPNYKV